MSDSTLRIMPPLIAKDLRLLRTPIVSLVAMGVVCYALTILACLTRGLAFGGDARFTTNALFFASTVANALTSLFAAVFGGMSIAGERRDRTCDFIALLPLTRKQIMLSKRMAGAAALTICAASHGMSALLIGICAVWDHVPVADIGDSMALWIGCTLSFFGIAWLVGTIIRSGAISACVSIAVTATVWVASAASLTAVETFAFSVIYPEGYRWHQSPPVPYAFMFISTAVGLFSMTAADLYYSRRIAP